MKKNLFSIIVLLLVVIGGWYLISKNNSSVEDTLSDNFVSIVNREKIPFSEFESIQTQLLKSQNIDITSLDDQAKSNLKTQVLDILIGQKLLQQAVKKSGIKATKEEILAQLDLIKSRFEDESIYKKALSEQGGTEEELIEQITLEITTQKFLNKELDLESVTATEDEIKTAYEQSASENENVPTLEEVSDQVKAFVISRKQQLLVNELVTKLRKKANIEILI
jgi:hypothetical protein